MPELRSTLRPQDDLEASLADRPQLRVLLAAPRGFCAGVRRAIDAVRDALATYGPPVYVRRPIVHNLDVVRALEAEGAVFVEELDEIPPGSVVIFSAHGVSPEVERDARQRQLTAFDAVCPLVSKVHREVDRHQRDGRSIILIGHRGHPEIDGTVGHAGGAEVFVVASVAEVAELPLLSSKPAAYAVQTTYSVEDAAAIVQALRERFSDLAEPNGSDICYATTNRQRAVRDIAGEANAMIVAGERFSSNACRLAEVAREHCAEVQLIAGASALQWDKIPAGGVLGITAAASTPDSTVDGILNALSARYQVQVEEVVTARETTAFKRLALS